ncbi:MAG: LysE family transporter [Planctomycetia bacterium]|nr:LysE family transporter [Planctomycetia bacterium]
MTSLTTAYLAAGSLATLFAFQGAVSPGPLQTVIISETLSNGLRSSWRAACISTITDPIALFVALCVVSSASSTWLACIAFFGATLLIRFALSQFRATAVQFENHSKKPVKLWTIWLVNITNPNLWIFSFTISAFQIHDFYIHYGFGVASTYVLTFFVMITAFNLMVAFLAGQLRRYFNGVWLARINRILGVFLILVAIRFIWLGLGYLGVFGSTSQESVAAILQSLFALG